MIEAAYTHLSGGLIIDKLGRCSRKWLEAALYKLSYQLLDL